MVRENLRIGPPFICAELWHHAEPAHALSQLLTYQGSDVWLATHFACKVHAMHDQRGVAIAITYSPKSTLYA